MEQSLPGVSPKRDGGDVIEIIDAMSFINVQETTNQQAVCRQITFRGLCAAVQCDCCIVLSTHDTLFKEHKMSVKQDIMTIAAALHGVRDTVEKRFCQTRPACQEKFQCFSNGQRDFSQCPLFGKSAEEISKEVGREIDIKLLLGDLSD